MGVSEHLEDSTTGDDADRDEVTDVHALTPVTPLFPVAEPRPDAAGRAPAPEAASDDGLPPAIAEGAPMLVVPLNFDGATQLFAGFDGGVTGVVVATHDPLPVGADARVVLVLPAGDRVHAAGTVAFARDPRELDGDAEQWPAYGLRFADGSLDAEGREALEAFAAIRPPLFYPD